MELIEKGKAIGELTQQADAMKNWSDRYADERKGILTAIRIIEIVPKVNAEPVRHGKWIDIDSQMYTWKVRCDQCGHERSMMSTQERYPRYCENCGVKMDEVEP